MLLLRRNGCGTYVGKHHLSLSLTHSFTHTHAHKHTHTSSLLLFSCLLGHTTPGHHSGEQRIVIWLGSLHGRVLVDCQTTFTFKPSSTEDTLYGSSLVTHMPVFIQALVLLEAWLHFKGSFTTLGTELCSILDSGLATNVPLVVAFLVQEHLPNQHGRPHVMHSLNWLLGGTTLPLAHQLALGPCVCIVHDLTIFYGVWVPWGRVLDSQQKRGVQ